MTPKNNEGCSGRAWRYGTAAVLAAAALPGCQKPQPVATAAAEDRHFVRGQVMAVDATEGSVELAHEAIPNFMPAMTMRYKVTDRAALAEIHPGDRIGADLLSDPSKDGPTNLRLANVDVLAQGRPDYRPAVQYHVPQPGEMPPDFRLLNQAGKAIHLAQYRGKVLILTFVYTRCPVADFCPRMSHNFAEIDTKLQADPKLYSQTHLLTVSFDPSYDTPAVLRSYGGAYTGRYTRETFSHWEFAVPSQAELPDVEKWFDMGVTPSGQTLQHSLATTVFGADGRVLAFYPTNTWTVDEALGVIRRAVR